MEEKTAKDAEGPSSRWISMSNDYLCYRLIHELHKNIYNVPSSKIIHFEGGSFKKVSYQHLKINIDGNIVYYSKAFGEGAALDYLRISRREFVKKKAIATFIHNADKKEQFRLYIQAIDEKMKELDGNVDK